MKTTMNGRVVAITGGARGIGLATAKAFAAAGAKVAIGDLDADLAECAAADIDGEVVEPEDVAAAVVAAARSHRGMSFAPRRLQFLLRPALYLPDRPRRFLGRITGTDGAFLRMDQAIRDAYHARAVAAAAQNAPRARPRA